MARTKPRGDIDFIIMASAQDENSLAELLFEYQQDYPTVEQDLARTSLEKRLAELVKEGKVGITGEKELSTSEAGLVIRKREMWLPSAPIHHHLFQKDVNYFGTFYGEQTS